MSTDPVGTVRARIGQAATVPEAIARAAAGQAAIAEATEAEDLISPSARRRCLQTSAPPSSRSAQKSST